MWKCYSSSSSSTDLVFSEDFVCVLLVHVNMYQCDECFHFGVKESLIYLEM